jgi:peptidylprolyl isomerase
MRVSRGGALLIGTALVLTACGSDRDDEASGSAEGTPPVAAATGTAPDVTAILEALHPDRAEPPTELLVTDLVEGDGRAISAGEGAVVQYSGVRWSDGGTFDSSWTRGQPFTFVLGAGQVISGWDLGVDGMRIGGRRVLTIPPALAYGDRGAGNVIGPGETLVFVVDLIDAVAP